MSIRRVLIGAGAASPFLVSSGGDAGSVDFTNLIFDGNQQPLRLWNRGYVTVNPVAKGALPLPVPQVDPTMSYSTPFGSPVFIVVGRSAQVNDIGLTLPLTTPWHRVADPLAKGSGQGFGGVISNADKLFYGLNFQDPNNNTDSGYPPNVAPTYVNYCIFKNYG